MQWVWDHSQSRNAQRLVLLAIADNAADDGTHAYPSNAEIQRKSALSERGVRTAVAELIKLGELRVEVNQGRRGTNMYSVIMTPADSAPQPNGRGANPAPRPRQDLPPTPAESAPGTVQEPSNEPSGTSFDAEASPTAQTIIRAFIDWLALPEQSAVQLTRRVIGIYAKTIKQLLGEGFEEILIKRALVEMHQRGMTGRPTLLEGFVVQVQNRPVSAPPASRPKLFEEMREDRTAQRKTRSQMIDATMDQLKADSPGMGVAEVVRRAAEMVDAHLKDHSDQLNGRTGTGYIVGDVIDNAQKEVTGSAT